MWSKEFWLGVDYKQLESWNWWCVRTSWAVLVNYTCTWCFSTLGRSVVDWYLHVSHGLLVLLKNWLTRPVSKECKSRFSIASLEPERYKTSVLRGNTALTDESRHSLLIILFSCLTSFHTSSFLCMCTFN